MRERYCAPGWTRLWRGSSASRSKKWTTSSRRFRSSETRRGDAGRQQAAGPWLRCCRQRVGRKPVEHRSCGTRGGKSRAGVDRVDGFVIGIPSVQDAVDHGHRFHLVVAAAAKRSNCGGKSGGGGDCIQFVCIAIIQACSVAIGSSVLRESWRQRPSTYTSA